MGWAQVLRRLLLPLAMLPGVASAQPSRQTDPGQLTDWYFASTFGTGAYRIGDRTVTVVRVPLGWKVREADDDGWGLRLKLPVTLGLYALDTAVADVLNTNFATLSVMPGIELERAVAHNWVLRPTASAGYAQDVVSGNRSTLWEVGVRSAWRHAFENADFTLGNAVLYAGNVAHDGVTQRVGVLSTGLNVVLPTGRSWLGRSSNIGLHLVHYLFFDRIDFLLTREDRRSVQQQYEAAITFGTYQPLKLGVFTFDRLGIGVRAGPDLFAVRLVTGFLF